MTESDQPAAEPPGSSGLTESTGRPESTGQPAVLVARDPERAAGLLALLRERGLDPVAAPVIERAPVEDPAELDAARDRVRDGAYDWVAITSVNAVDALLAPAPDVSDTPRGKTTPARSVADSRQRLLSATHPAAPTFPPDDTPGDTQHAVVGSARWAAVGPATRQALAGYGVAVDLVAAVATGAGLAETFPAAPAGQDARPRVLLPLGDLASDTLRAGLVAKGWAVDVVTAYRTVAREIPRELRRRYDVVVVTSGSAARQVAAQLGPQRVVAIGEPSAGTARVVGHTVLAVAGRPTDEALADAVTTAVAAGANVAPEPGT
ncbi:uroporphyrinogen-III synthase [Promicromonospora sp. AC04]|uniref:uroporphyrinogen-III synthase n=1 Tax=Promicromonospora sp. AC04 TaxID=2135723 RepID=UPI000D3950FA|nr:uroporphyrinogen-III synthase [Promicromonospora sp. AC04]PUB29051.1 uroporphyrinogen-III synthase [Promicromonospora sp. AC04]